jgi:hypothetical protein
MEATNAVTNTAHTAFVKPSHVGRNTLGAEVDERDITSEGGGKVHSRD